MMTNLINDLLDQAKLENSAFELHNEWFNMHEVIEEAFQIIALQAQRKKISLVQEIDVSKLHNLKNVFGDRRRYLQILLNFISNSLKFTNKEGCIKVSLFVVEI